ncbi:MAG: glutamate synthase [Planctomycetes bacterium]|nr:glutamate synthase [Planctomycetota bacterium]
MVELVCTSFGNHIVRMHRELRTQSAVFDFPKAKWFTPDPDGPDLSVMFHGLHAANPAGPAAGPHGQMAQNIVLSYLAGGRILELKTVQINDELDIPRPCIDATNVGYNVEWSQELRLHESLHEYVSGSMLVHILRHGEFFDDVDMQGSLGDVIYDMSVGYDLEGIQHPRVRRFISGMIDAKQIIDSMRLQIPSEYRHLRDLDYPTTISRSITLSTFHGCPADEIERICEHLIEDYAVNVIIKMNPPMLGKEKLEHLLHDVMGYKDITVHPPAYTSGLQFDESIDILKRLDALAKKRGLRCGAKFSNTLEVANHRDFFTADNEVMYLSGQPLYVLAMALAAKFRAEVDATVPISFSAGIDQKNFADTVSCGIAPVTVCTDLLRPGGYARMPKYLHQLAKDMQELGATNIDDFILKRCDQPAITNPAVTNPDVAGHRNTSAVAKKAASNPRYGKDRNKSAPKRIGSHLVVFDCITCDKCIPVCPNDANFTYPLAEQDFEYCDLIVSPDGTVSHGTETHEMKIERSMQIANFGDYCNECGNCDTFCPEYGGPFIKKPTFFSRLEEFQLRSDHDGFFASRTQTHDTIHARIGGTVFLLKLDRKTRESCFVDDATETHFDKKHAPIRSTFIGKGACEHTVNMNTYHTMRLLLEGILDTARLNPINANVPVD